MQPPCRACAGGVDRPPAYPSFQGLERGIAAPGRNHRREVFAGSNLRLDVYKRQDLLLGVAGAALVRLAVYVKGKNRKKFRQGEEYGLSLIHI